MKWTVLVDNRANNPSLEMTEQREQPSSRQGCERIETEHGLSILLETEKHSILLDTGASDMLIRNAERLEIDLSRVDYVFISHGHSDHAGGLRYFMDINKTAKIIASQDAIDGKFYSKRQYLHSITTSWPEIPDNKLVAVSDSCKIDDSLQVIAHIPQMSPMPKGNQHLFIQCIDGKYAVDDFRHEMALYVDGLLFTGCAHSGLENILAACRFPVNEVVGGFHLLDGYETEEELLALAHRLRTNYPHTQFYTSHCTGDLAFSTLQRVMGGQIHPFSCGTTIEI